MDEINQRRDEQYINENRNKTLNILALIFNKDKIKQSIVYHEFKTLNDAQKLISYLKECANDRVLLLTDHSQSHTIFMNNGNYELLADNISQVVRDILVDFEFYVDLLAIPNVIGFRNSEKAIHLLNYDEGTIEC